MPLYEARNLAINHCTGGAIAFLDADDIWMPDKLTKQVSLIKSGEKFVYTGYKTINIKSKDEVCYNGIYKGNITNSILYNNSISISSVIITKDILNKYKFDKYYNILGDIDLWYRIAKNFNLKTTCDIQVINRLHESNLSKTLKKEWIKERRYFYKKLILKINRRFNLSTIIYIVRTELKGLLHKI